MASCEGIVFIIVSCVGVIEKRHHGGMARIGEVRGRAEAWR